MDLRHQTAVSATRRPTSSLSPSSPRRDIESGGGVVSASPNLFVVLPWCGLFQSTRPFTTDIVRSSDSKVVWAFDWNLPFSGPLLALLCFIAFRLYYGTSLFSAIFYQHVYSIPASSSLEGEVVLGQGTALLYIAFLLLVALQDKGDLWLCIYAFVLSVGTPTFLYVAVHSGVQLYSELWVGVAAIHFVAFVLSLVGTVQYRNRYCTRSGNTLDLCPRVQPVLRLAGVPLPCVVKRDCE